MHVALLASGEFLTAAGGTDRGCVGLLYERLLGIASPSQGDLAYWVGRTGLAGPRGRRARDLRVGRLAGAAGQGAGAALPRPSSPVASWTTGAPGSARAQTTTSRSPATSSTPREYLRRAEVRFPSTKAPLFAGLSCNRGAEI